MATYVGTATRVYLGVLDLSGLANEVAFGPLTRASVPFTTFGDGGFETQKPGIASGQGTIKGYQDFASGGLDQTVNVGSVGSQYAFTVFPNPTGTVTAGDRAHLARGVIGNEDPIGGKLGEAGMFELGISYDAAFPYGSVAHPSTARTANGTGTAVALTGPTAAQKLYSALHVTAFSGFTNVVFTIESDDNSGFSSAATRITHTTVTGVTNEFSSVAGNFSTETYHRIKWVVTGSGSVTFVASFGVTGSF